MKKQLAIALASAFAAAAPAAHAAYDRYGNWYDEGPRDRDAARVIDSRPVYADSGGQHEECWNPRAGHFEERRDGGHSAVNGGTVGGAVVGGVVGHQFDHGSAGATLGGALIGGLIGNQVNKEHHEQDDLDYSRCRMVGSGEPVIQGYETRYVYRGREYTAMLPEQPGPELYPGNEIREDGRPR